MKEKTKVIIIIGIILACLALGVWGINRFVLPVKVKGLIVNLVRERTGYDINIGRINYLPLTQLYLKDVALYDKDLPEAALINIKELSFSFRLWPLLSKREIIAHLDLKDLTNDKITLNGSTFLSLKRRPFPAQRPFFNDLDGVIKFIDFSLVTNNPPSSLESINGTLTIQDNHMNLSKTFFNYKDRIYNMEGVLTDLDKDEPRAAILLNSDILTSEGKFIIKDDYIKIEDIQGKLFDSSFNIMGDIKGLTSTTFNLYGEAKTDLTDIKKLYPESKYIQDSLKPGGICHVAFLFNGGLGDIKACEANIKLKSDKVFLHGLALDDLYLDLMMKEGLVNTQRFDIRPYLGLLNGYFSLDLNKENHPYSLSLALKDGNLAKFSSDTSLGKEELAGLISSKCFLKGDLISIDSLRGSGWITVADGRLWEIPFLSGVADLLSMPHLRSVTFKEAAGNFIIDQRRISTEDLTFYSDSINMTSTGSVDFNGNIDFLLNTNITQDLIKGSSDATKIANLLISQAGNYMGKIRVTGTWSKPQYRFAAKPVEEIFKKEIKGLLEDMLR